MRLLTRSDFDGLACASLLIHLQLVDDFKFVHPKDLQDGLIQVDRNDILANVPYVKGCGLWFDHHSSEEERGSLQEKYQGMSRNAPSCARVIYEYYGSEKFGPEFDEIMRAVDKSDSAQFTIEEILNPGNWTLLSFIMDPRTGLGRVKTYRISNYQLMEKLARGISKKNIKEIMADPDVKERVVVYFEQSEKFMDMVKQHSNVRKNVLITDLRNVSPIYPGNRFMPYALFPDVNISIWIIDGKIGNCVFTCGKSIVNRTSKVDIGSIMLKHGGGGHFNAGTCQVTYNKAVDTLNDILNNFME